MVWNDEFDGPKLDYSKWEIEVNAFGGGNNELQIYTDRRENVRIEEGRLILQARKDNHGIAGTVREYSSGPHSQQEPRRLEVRKVRDPREASWRTGRLAAIWMLPTDEVYGT
jgi:3'-phosphoadenosine 5'-phosphosulfate sulfotransferase